MNFQARNPRFGMNVCTDNTYNIIYNEGDNNDLDGDDGNDDKDDYRCKLVNFQSRTSTFCMEVDLFFKNSRIYLHFLFLSNKILEQFF